MKKLNVEDLVVDSFATSETLGMRGTIAAHQVSNASACNTYCMTEAYRASCPGGECTDPETGGGGTERTRAGVTCNVTCLKGVTDCGTCYPGASCDGGYGCQGTSMDMMPC
jgi:hypothetical protein